MSTQVQCDHFGQEQYVPAHQVRTMLSVYIASHDQRKANNGLGCSVKDLFSGEEKKLKIAALTKMGARFPDGKKVKAYALHSGKTYTMLGTPAHQNCGVFIVPKGDKYSYIFNGQPLPPGSCLVWDGKKSKVIGYRLFRKLFIMGQNPVSAGKMKGAGQQHQQGAGQQHQQGAGQQHQHRAGQQHQHRAGQHRAGQQATINPTTQCPVGFPPQTHRQVQNYGHTQAQPQTQHNSQPQYVVLGRLLRNGELVGLMLTDGNNQAQIPLKQCMAYADRGELKNVKLVNRNGTKFLSGTGIALESLPYKQV